MVRRVGAPGTARISALCAVLALCLFTALAMVVTHPGTTRGLDVTTGHVHDVPAAHDALPGEQDHTHDDDGTAHHHHHGDADAGVLLSLPLLPLGADHHPRPRAATSLPAWTSNGTDRPD